MGHRLTARGLVLGGPAVAPPGGLAKKIAILKVCYPRCVGVVDRLA